MILHRKPLEWYVNKLRRGEPFTSLLYGDGEFLVAAGKRTGALIQNGEMVTAALAYEMRESLAVTESNIYRGTDPYIADPASYPGMDVAAVGAMHAAMMEVAGENSEWYDGVVWERAVMEGKLGPLLQILNGRKGIVVVNSVVLRHLPLRDLYTPVLIDHRNACARLEEIYCQVAALLEPGHVVICCAGIMTVPLLVRLRGVCPQATLLDLGSTFDLFAHVGTRGWHQELYRDSARWRELVARNLEGVSQPWVW